MRSHIRIRGRFFSFRSLYEVMAKANEEKSGDRLAGIGAESELERVAAKALLAEMELRTFREYPAVPYESDEVTRLIQDALDEDVYREIRGWSLAQLREYVLSHTTGPEDLRRLSRGLTSEMIAGLAKIMSNMDLVVAASKIYNHARCRTTIGIRGTLASRLQPNHPTDDPDGIAASIKDGLAYGVGDALIGINPVEDTPSNIRRLMEHVFRVTHEELEVPTQISILAHISTQMEALRAGGTTDLLFQSIAGTEKANRSFGVTSVLLEEARLQLRHRNPRLGPNVFYFETGQGSELSSCAHEGVDQVTLEARCYGFARIFRPFLVNTVVGFIGPEYLYDAKQVLRAGLEDVFMGKLHGLPMGIDVCYTNHMRMDQNDLENLAVLVTAARACYLMGVPMGDDVMLNYQTTSYHDVASLRQLFGLRPLPEFERWLASTGIMHNGALTQSAADPSCFSEWCGEEECRAHGS